MTKKIRLLDEPETQTEEVATMNNESSEALTGPAVFTAQDVEVLMKYVEAIDWKLWELLKLQREAAGK